MLHTDHAIARIRAYLKTSGVAKSRLAENAGVPEGSTRNIKSPEWNPTAETLRKIEDAIPKDFIFEPKRNGKANGHG